MVLRHQSSCLKTKKAGDIMGMGFLNRPPPSVVISEKVKEEDLKRAEKGVEDWLFEELPAEEPHLCALIMGQDGTGKSGLVLDAISDKDIENGYKLVILDLDGGVAPLVSKYHKDRRKGITVKNPMVMSISETGDVIIDYSKTINRIKGVTKYVSENWRDKKIKAFCFDGLSTLTKYCEYQMRIEKHILPEGGVDMRYWKIRYQTFMEIIETIKALPIDTFFIAHEDFIQKQDREISALKEKMNQMAFQKIRCIRKDLPDRVEYSSVIDKNKLRTETEGRETVFCEVVKGGINEEGKAFWKGKGVLDNLR